MSSSLRIVRLRRHSTGGDNSGSGSGDGNESEIVDSSTKNGAAGIKMQLAAKKHALAEIIAEAFGVTGRLCDGRTDIHGEDTDADGAVWTVQRVLEEASSTDAARIVLERMALQRAASVAPPSDDDEDTAGSADGDEEGEELGDGVRDDVIEKDAGSGNGSAPRQVKADFPVRPNYLGRLLPMPRDYHHLRPQPPPPHAGAEGAVAPSTARDDELSGGNRGAPSRPLDVAVIRATAPVRKDSPAVSDIVESNVKSRAVDGGSEQKTGQRRAVGGHQSAHHQAQRPHVPPVAVSWSQRRAAYVWACATCGEENVAERVALAHTLRVHSSDVTQHRHPQQQQEMALAEDDAVLLRCPMCYCRPTSAPI